MSVDYLDECITCKTKIEVGDEVVVTSYAKLVEEPVKSEIGMLLETAVFEESQENYIGVYCLDCHEIRSQIDRLLRRAVKE
jgi:hypothetical protein